MEPSDENNDCSCIYFCMNLISICQVFIFNDYLFYFIFFLFFIFIYLFFSFFFAINTIKNQNGGHVLSIQVLSLKNGNSPFRL